MNKYFCVLVLSAFVVSCTKTEKIIERLPPENAAESFSTSSSKKNALIIKKSSLGKAFLLIATSKTMSKTPQWQDHPIKVVSLEMYQDQIGLYELSRGNVYDNIEASRLLQTFQVLEETRTEVFVDLQKGFQSLNMSPNLELAASDSFSKSLDALGADTTIQIVDSLVKKKEVTKERVLIVQDSRVRSQVILEQKQDPRKKESEDAIQKPVKDVEYSLQTYFELVPYVENENFKSLPLDPELRLGLFTLDTVSPGSAEVIKTTVRWDTSENRAPIRYILSKDIPAKLVPQITEGLEYWNLVFGRKVLTVEQSQESDLLPQDRAVLVRWVNWKDAGFAYAGLQANPLTGEILRGQIFMPEFWMHLEDSLGKNPKLQQVHDKKSFAKYNLLHTVAHEAGHVFGMRHNFSSSFAVQTEQSVLEKIRGLIRKGTKVFESVATSTSVMEYADGLDIYISGKFMEKTPLSYDKDLIEWAYLGKAEPATEKWVFCTDDHLMKSAMSDATVIGCQRGDFAGNPILNEIIQLDDGLETAGAGTLASLASHLYPAGGGRVPLKPETAIYLYEPFVNRELKSILFEQKSGDEELFKLWTIQDVTESVISDIRSGLNTNEVRTNSLSGVLSDLSKKTFEDPLFEKIVAGTDAKVGASQLRWQRFVDNLLSDPSVRKVQSYSGEEYTLTEKDLKEIKVVLLQNLWQFEMYQRLGRIKALLPPASGEQTESDPKTQKEVIVKVDYRSRELKEVFAPVAYRHMFELLKLRKSEKLIGTEFWVRSMALPIEKLQDIAKHISQKDRYVQSEFGFDLLFWKKQFTEDFKNQLIPFLKTAGASEEEILNDWQLAYTTHFHKTPFGVQIWHTQQKQVLEILNQLPDQI